MSVEARMSKLEGLIIDMSERMDKLLAVRPKEQLSISEAAELLGFEESYLYKLTSGKSIPHYKLGRKAVRFKRSELESWMEARRVKTTDEVAGDAQIHLHKKRKA